MERITRFRAIAMLLAFALILSLFGVRMYSVQMLDAGDIVADSDTYTTYYTVKAARGEILDRNGNVMVGNRASYDLVFNNFVLTNSDDPNDHLLRLIRMTEQLGVETSSASPSPRPAPTSTPWRSRAPTGRAISRTICGIWRSTRISLPPG